MDMSNLFNQTSTFRYLEDFWFFAFKNNITIETAFQRGQWVARALLKPNPAPVPHPGGQPHHMPPERGNRKASPCLALSANESDLECTASGPGSKVAR